MAKRATRTRSDESWGDFSFPEGEDPAGPAWWAPLEGVARAVEGNPRYRFFDLADFMLMCRQHRKKRPSLLLYKHYYTRRYINLDDAGHAYKYVAVRDGDDWEPGRYVRHRSLSAALDALDLWELPWMKPELEHERGGLEWEDRGRLHPDESADADT